MKTKELKRKSKTDLEKLLKEKREHLRILRFGLASGTIKNTREIRATKKDIARIFTLLKEQSISERGRGNPSVSPCRKRLKTEGF